MIDIDELDWAHTDAVAHDATQRTREEFSEKMRDAWPAIAKQLREQSAELATLREFARRVRAVHDSGDIGDNLAGVYEWLAAQPGNTTSEPTDEQLEAVAAEVLGDDIRDAANCARRWWLAFRRAVL